MGTVRFTPHPATDTGGLMTTLVLVMDAPRPIHSNRQRLVSIPIPPPCEH